MTNSDDDHYEHIKGLGLGLSYYLVGTLITLVVHSIYGWEYIHAPPPSAGVVIIFLLGSILRAIWITRNIIRQKNVRANKFELMVHALPAIAGLIIAFSITFIN